MAKDNNNITKKQRKQELLANFKGYTKSNGTKVKSHRRRTAR